VQATDEADEVIPADCCYFCLTRGGNAAYECHKEEGEDICTRCIRDKKKSCRLPTLEESAAIAARCPRCTIRGFKKCDGGDPCDTCTRNKTTHLCRKPREKKKPKLDEPHTRIEIAPQSEDVVASEQSSRGRTTKRMEAHRTSNDAQLNPENVCDGPDRSTTSNGTARSKRRKVLRNSTPPECTQVASPKLSPSRLDLRKDPRTPENSVDANDETRDCDDTLPSPVTSNDIVLADDPKQATAPIDEDIKMEHLSSDQEKEIGASTLVSSGRTSRARPRISYVEQYLDDVSDPDVGLASKEEDESDVYNAPATDEEEESELEIELAFSDEQASIMSDAESLDSIVDEDVIPAEDEKPKANLRKNVKTGDSARAGKGIDLSLPPLSSIQECMSDMTAKAVELGLCEALEGLGDRPIRVATMCSGTESPLLALDEISKGQSHLRLQWTVS
jgi:hypothetical protein